MGYSNFIQGYNGYSNRSFQPFGNPQIWQWQPSINVHNPNPPITLENSTGGILYRWDGSNWVLAKLLVYNGSSWVSKPLYRWDGATWQPVQIAV